MSQPTSTKHDDVNEDNAQQGFNSFPFALLILIASPLTVVSALLTYVVFAVGRIRMSVILLFGLIPYLFFLLFFWQFALTQFVESFTVTLPSIIQQNIGAVEGILRMLAEQALISIPLGISAGLIYSAYRWYTRPIWVERTFRLTPWEIFKKKKNIKDIQLDKNTPRDGMTLGVGDKGERIVQTFEESKAHSLVLGASGAGKTKMIESRLRDAIKNGQGAVIIDLKGGKELAETAAKLAKRYDKKFQHWLFQPIDKPYDGPALNGAAYYDPIGRGEATRRKDLLIESRKWSEEHYKIQASYFLQNVMSVIVANPKEGISTFTDVIHLLDPKALQQRAIPLGVNPNYAELVRQIDKMNDEKMDATLLSSMKGLAAQFGVLLNSVAGPYLQRDPKGKNNIDLFRAAQEGEIVVFSLDSSSYPDQVKLIANLIIQDLKTVSSELRVAPAKEPFQVVIDEFSAVGSENIIGLINKSRDAKMPVTLTTQALGDLRQNSETLQDQLLGIINSFIIQRTNTLDDAIEIAGLSGKTIRKRFSESVVYKTGFLSKGAAAGKGNIEDVEDFTILPQQIQALKTGEFFYINKNPMRIEHGFCIMENTDSVVELDEKKVNFVEDVDFKDANAPITEEMLVPGQLSTPPSFEGSNGLPLFKPNTNSNASSVAPVGGSENVRPVDMDRIKTLIKNPEILLPNKPTRKDDYVVKVMPERVAPELPKTVSNSQSLPGGLPNLPKLPQLPSRPQPKIAPSSPAPVQDKTAVFPSLPPIPTSKANPESPAKPQKDEFDF